MTRRTAQPPRLSPTRAGRARASALAAVLIAAPWLAAPDRAQARAQGRPWLRRDARAVSFFDRHATQDPRPAAPAGHAALADIDAFAFDSAMAMGVGGFLTTRIFPVVLFRNGDVLTDVEGLAYRGGLAAHRRDHPRAWTQWRRSGAHIEVRKGTTWSRLPFAVTYPRLPDGFRLDGTFRALSAAGTGVFGGAQDVTAWTEYRFWPDGRVTRGGGAGARGAATDASVVTSATAPTREGAYRVDGLEIIMTWGDGSVDRRILVTDPADAKSAIWLDGVGYPRQRR